MIGLKRRQRESPSISAGSMADIAFLLLIFFLVATEILEETGIRVKLPPWDPTVEATPINDDNVFAVLVNASNELLIEKEPAKVETLKKRAKEFIMNPNGLSNLPSKPKNAVISLQNDRGTAYHKYLEVYNEIKAAYNELWEEASQRRFGKHYVDLDEADKQDVRKDIPLIISEAAPTDYEKGE